MQERYQGPGAAERMRARAGRFAAEAYGLTEEQLICMVYSPFTDAGQRLPGYLEREHPRLAAQAGEVRGLLGGDGEPGRHDQARLACWLTGVSALNLGQLRTLWRAATVRFSPQGGTTLIAAILDGDPHKAMIKTRLAADGPVSEELITGR